MRAEMGGFSRRTLFNKYFRPFLFIHILEQEIWRSMQLDKDLNASLRGDR